MALNILSWGHRRATDPLRSLVVAFAAEEGRSPLEMHERPLSDFEHQGIAGACATYDIVVFDHPFCGDIAAGRCMRPLEDLFADGAIPGEDSFVGPSLRSYFLGGRTWGLPIDAATQHALYRPDLLAAEEVPTTWDEVLDLGERIVRLGRKLAMAFASPHAILAAGAIMSNAGTPWQMDPEGDVRIDPDALSDALSRLAAVAAFCPEAALGWNSIACHDALTQQDDLVYAPCVYGFATYGEADMRTRLAFGPQPGVPGSDGAGALIGGAALGVSASCRDIDLARRFVAFCADPERQSGLVGGNHGQPAAAPAWTDAALNVQFNGYFGSIAPALATSAIRPRCAGYPAFQARAGHLAAACLAGKAKQHETVAQIVSLADELNRARRGGLIGKRIYD